MRIFEKNDDCIKFLGVKLWEKPEQKAFSISPDDMLAYAGQTSNAPFENSVYDGDKFWGGYGVTQLLEVDYWTLRARSSELFTNNLYARGIVRRLVTNEINTGLSPEATPEESIIGVEEDSLNSWTEDVETRFNIWGKNPLICDWQQKRTFGALQRQIRMEALISGDILIILKQSHVTKMPMVQLVSGSKVKTPLSDDAKIRKGNKVKHGVETNKKGRVVAYWIQQDDFEYKRIPTYGEKTGRKTAWLVFGTDKRLDDLRGQPLLTIVLQSLKEIDRYRDSAQRKAVISSMYAGFVKKGEDKMGSLPITGGAVRKGQVDAVNSDNTTRSFSVAEQVPGVIIEELQQGEEIIFKGGEGTDVNYGEFEEAIIQAVAWTLEIPPEVLKLSFSNNYSASQAAINEFKIAINRTWGDFGETVCTPIYIEILVSQVLLQKIDAPGFLEAWRDPSKYEIFGAWTSSDWYGSIKPSTDMLKQGKGSEILVKHAWSTNAREARITTGTKFSRNVKRLKRENEQLVEAMRPVKEFEAEFTENVEDDTTIEALEETKFELIDLIEETGTK